MRLWGEAQGYATALSKVRRSIGEVATRTNGTHASLTGLWDVEHWLQDQVQCAMAAYRDTALDHNQGDA